MNKKQIAITLGIMCFILTLAISIQLKTVYNSADTTNLSQSREEDELRDEVLMWKEKYDNEYLALTESSKKLEDIRKQATQNDTHASAKQEEIRKNNIRKTTKK